MDRILSESVQRRMREPSHPTAEQLSFEQPGERLFGFSLHPLPAPSDTLRCGACGRVRSLPLHPLPSLNKQHENRATMDRTEIAVRDMLSAIEGQLYDIGVLSSRGMLPGLDAIRASAVLERLPLLKYRNARGSHIYIRPSGEHRYTVLDDLDQTKLARLSADGFEPCAVVETSTGNFQAWLKHVSTLPKLLGTFAAQTLAARYGADPSAADWRRFGRLPGFTNCKPKYKRDDGLFPFVRLHTYSGQQFSKASAFFEEITAAYEAREREREQRHAEVARSPRRGPRSLPSLERFRTSTKFADRPAAADIAFCVAAYACGMDEARMAQALEDDYLSRDPSPSKRAAYIRRTMTKARDWAAR